MTLFMPRIQARTRASKHAPYQNQKKKEKRCRPQKKKDVWYCIMHNGYQRRVRNVVCTDEDITNK
jgi:hypothetical protein